MTTTVPFCCGGNCAARASNAAPAVAPYERLSPQTAVYSTPSPFGTGKIATFVMVFSRQN